MPFVPCPLEQGQEQEWEGGSAVVQGLLHWYCSAQPAGGGGTAAAQQVLALLLLAGYGGLAFLFLSRLAGSFFCPNLAFVSGHLRLSQTVSGLTLAALGNGAADLFSTAAAFQHGTHGLALGELVGSSLFTACLLSAILAYWFPFQVPARPYLRDTIVFTIALVGTALIVADGHITLWESVGMITFYALFVVCVARGYFVAGPGGHRHPPGIVPSPCRDMAPGAVSVVIIAGDSEDPPGELVGETGEGTEETAPLLRQAVTDSPSAMDLHSAVSPAQPESVPCPACLAGEDELFAIPWPRADPQLELDITPSFPAPPPCTRAGSLIEAPPHPQGPLLADQGAGNPGTPQSLLPVAPVGLPGAPPDTTITRCPSALYSPASVFLEPRGASWTSQLLHVLRLLLLKDVIRLERWREASVLGRCKLLLGAPILLVGKFTIPIARHHYSGVRRVQVCLQLAAIPWVAVLVLLWESGSPDLMALLPASSPLVRGGGVGAYALVGGASALLAGAGAWAFFTRFPGPVPPGCSFAIGLAGFLSAMLWIYLAASELASLFTTLSAATGLSGVAIGLSLFAAGNCVGDVVTNLSVAKSGLPLMAFGACMGSSLLNIILGIGLSALALTLQHGLQPVPIRLEAPTLLLLACALLVGALWAGFTMVAACGWRVDNRYGALMASAYALALALVLALG